MAFFPSLASALSCQAGITQTHSFRQSVSIIQLFYAEKHGSSPLQPNFSLLSLFVLVFMAEERMPGYPSECTSGYSFMLFGICVLKTGYGNLSSLTRRHECLQMSFCCFKQCLRISSLLTNIYFPFTLDNIIKCINTTGALIRILRYGGSSSYSNENPTIC